MSQESSKKENAGGLAYNVILKPAAKTESPCLTPRTKSRIEACNIAEKLHQAQIRRESMEAEKLQTICKNRARAQEAIDRMKQEEENMKIAAQEKLSKKLDTSLEIREQQITQMRERLRNHLKHVEEVCNRSSMVTSDLEERLKRKYESAEENRRAQIEALLEKLREHAKHIEEVCKSSEDASKANPDKMIQRMESALKKREENIQALQERLQEHEKHIQEVRKNKQLGAGDASINCE